MSRAVTTLLPYYGGNRTNASRPAELLAGCRWIGIPFAGGMPELLHITAPTIVASDLHCHVINLARALQKFGDEFIESLQHEPFHPVVLQAAQDRLNAGRNHVAEVVRRGSVDINAAQDYFVSQWMGRSGNAGKARELAGHLPVRRNANGGDSNTRYRSAIRSIEAFQSVMTHCNFVCEDCFEFLAKCNDTSDVGLYLDPPWPDAGAEYLHRVDDSTFHHQLRDRLLQFEHARIVVRYGDHPLIRDLYASDQWVCHEVTGRKQSRSAQAELYLERIQ